MAVKPVSREEWARIQLVLSDVDGVLTDGRIYMGPKGEAFKAFSAKDGEGVAQALRAGLRVGWVSGRTSRPVSQRAAELGISLLLQGVKDKGAACRRLIESLGLSPSEAAFVGDDEPDLKAFAEVGLPVAVADAAAPVRNAARIVTASRGGEGALREVINAILDARQG